MKATKCQPSWYKKNSYRKNFSPNLPVEYRTSRSLCFPHKPLLPFQNSSLFLRQKIFFPMKAIKKSVLVGLQTHGWDHHFDSDNPGANPTNKETKNICPLRGLSKPTIISYLNILTLGFCFYVRTNCWHLSDHCC